MEINNITEITFNLILESKFVIIEDSYPHPRSFNNENSNHILETVISGIFIIKSNCLLVASAYFKYYINVSDCKKSLVIYSRKLNSN